MDRGPGNPPDPRLLWGLTAVEALVVALAGGILFFWPELAGARWPWARTPFNTAALGAVYLGALVAIVALVAVGRWAPARLVVPAIGAFTAIMLLIALAYYERFDLTRWGTRLWLAAVAVLLGVGLETARQGWTRPGAMRPAVQE